jgi:hypothetical protein
VPSRADALRRRAPGLLLPPLAALTRLIDVADVQPGQKVLVIGS